VLVVDVDIGVMGSLPDVHQRESPRVTY